MVVWNYAEKRVQILSITQKTIMTPLYNYEQMEEWGDLKGYDIEITKKKEGDKTNYLVSAIPPKALAQEIKDAYTETKVDLSKIFEGEYPIEEEINPEDIPF
jgi:hypothetical protein